MKTIAERSEGGCKPLILLNQPKDFFFQKGLLARGSAFMTANRTIYVINQSPELVKVWRELSDAQKREVLKECETADETEVEMIICEIVEGQRRLF